MIQIRYKHRSRHRSHVQACGRRPSGRCTPHPPCRTSPAILAVTGRPSRMPLPKPCLRQWRRAACRPELHSTLFVVGASSCHAAGRTTSVSTCEPVLSGAQASCSAAQPRLISCGSPGASRIGRPEQMQQQRSPSKMERSAPPYEASPGGPLCGPSSSHAGAKPDGHTGAAATACNDHVGGMIFVSKSTSRHWDVDFDGTTVDLSTDGRIQARGIPCGPGEALGPVRRAIPGRRVASARCALFCNEIYDIVTKFFTCVSNRSWMGGHLF